MFGKYKKIREELFDLQMEMRYMQHQLKALEEEKAEHDELQWGDYFKPKHKKPPEQDPFYELMEDIRSAIEDAADSMDMFKVRIEFEEL